jgi:SagB-type dehydrogenase family enzyme
LGTQQVSGGAAAKDPYQARDAVVEIPAIPRRSKRRSSVFNVTRSLPRPRTSGGLALNDAITRRRSARAWRAQELGCAQLSQLLWAAQGASGQGEGRVVPSPGGLYPLVLHLLTAAGVERYLPATHALEPVTTDDRRRKLAHACLEQDFVGEAPAVLVFASMRRRARAKYGARAERYGLLEAGHAAQNVLLEAVSLGLAGVPVGAFYDLEVRRDAAFKADEAPLYVLAVGYPETREPTARS